MKIKAVFYASVVTLVALFANLQKANAQVPCGATGIHAQTLFTNWPQFRYDVSHTGCNPYESILSPTTVGNLVLNWSYQAGTSRFPPISSPAVANGIVYESGPQYLYALKASTGALVWQHNTSAGLSSSSPAVANGVVYVGSDDFDVYALNASSGSLLWTYVTDMGMVISSPAVANGVLYFGSADRNVYALKAATGELLWKYTTEQGIGSSPAVANGAVYIGLGTMSTL